MLQFQSSGIVSVIQIFVINYWYLTLQPLKMDLTEGSETSAIINQTRGITLKKVYYNYYMHSTKSVLAFFI